jgi:hypothetical protein
MADNVDITPGTGATVAADEIGGVKYQRVKLSLGADGTANDASAGAGAVGTGTQRVTLASDDPLVVGATGSTEYETVAASQTAQALGATGAAGDLVSGLLVIPATTSPGAVALLDDATSITVFAGGALSVGDLKPFFIPLGLKSVSGAWKVTTGANVSVIGMGNFT